MKSYKSFMLLMVGMAFTTYVSAGDADNVTIKNELNGPISFKFTWIKKKTGMVKDSSDYSYDTIKLEPGKSQVVKCPKGKRIQKVTPTKVGKGWKNDKALTNRYAHGNRYYVTNKDANGNDNVDAYDNEAAYNQAIAASAK